MAIAENLKRGLIDLLLLSLIAEKDMYGYELSQELAKRSNQQFTLQEGSLYTPLYRMEQAKFLSTKRVDVPNSRRFRVYYHLLPKGAEQLEEMRKEYLRINRGALSVMNMEVLRANDK